MDKIIPGIKELTWKYNYANADIKSAKKKFEDLPDLMKREAEAIPDLVEISKNDLEKCTIIKAVKCQNQLNEVLEELKLIIGSN